MNTLTSQGQHTLRSLAQKYQISEGAVESLLQAVRNGNGSMAQFYIPELGGGGQWMRGGMTMVGDMFNHGLKAKVDGLCSDLSQALANGAFNAPPAPAPAPAPSYANSNNSFQNQHQSNDSNSGGFTSAPSHEWYPSDLGHPSTSGSQNDMRYAWFPSTQRLAVQVNNQVTIFDTQDHQIGGVSQQQSGGGLGSLKLSSQYGDVDIHRLPVISGPGPR